MSVIIDTIYAGKVAPLGENGRPSAIAKQEVTGSVRLTTLGLEVDAQADKSVHGGVSKALHHYPAENYARLAAAFPAAQHLHPGGLGENLSTRGLIEADICIGDIYTLGAATIQVSQPRTPCWKIDARTECEGVTAFIAANGLAGWYYRVLTPGLIQAGDRLQRIERQADAVSVPEFWAILHAQRPEIAAVRRVADAVGLDPDWARKLRERADWLERNA
jgi:MOSC domain-containing protein YiiM